MTDLEARLEALRLASIGDREHPDYLKATEARFLLFIKLLDVKND